MITTTSATAAIQVARTPAIRGGSSQTASGAGSSAHGFMDSHNSHLDPDSGFTADDFRSCAARLEASPQAVFLGMKCSAKKGDDEVTAQEALSAQTDLLRAV